MEEVVHPGVAQLDAQDRAPSSMFRFAVAQTWETPSGEAVLTLTIIGANGVANAMASARNNILIDHNDYQLCAQAVEIVSYAHPSDGASLRVHEGKLREE
jgi:hypothetical protein